MAASGIPKNGLLNVKDAVLSAVWKSFHEGGIEFPFPQRDLHIKDAVEVHFVDDKVDSGSDQV